MLAAILTCFRVVRLKLAQRRQQKYIVYPTADYLTTLIVCQLATAAAAVVVAVARYVYTCRALQQAHIEYDSRHTEKCQYWSTQYTRSFNEKLTLLTATKQVSSIAHRATVSQLVQLGSAQRSALRSEGCQSIQRNQTKAEESFICPKLWQCVCVCLGRFGLALQVVIGE